MSRHALVIGIEKYQSQNLPNLSKAVADTEKIQEILIKYGDCKKNQVTILTEKTQPNGNVTSDDLVKVFKDFLAEKTGDRIIYFSGHGILSSHKPDEFEDEFEHNGYIAAHNCKVVKKQDRFYVEEGGIKLKSLVNLIGKSHVSSLIIIFDACHSGSLIEEIEKNFANFSHIPQYYFIGACQSWEQSWEKESDKYSQFTNALINAISESEIEKNNGELTISQAYEATEKVIANLGSSTTNRGRQKPICLGKGGSLTFVKYRPTVYWLQEDSIDNNQISSEKIETLKTILQPIDRSKLAWATIETISSEDFERWLDEDISMGIDSFISVINSLPPLADGSSPLLKIMCSLANQKNVESTIKNSLKRWLQKFSIRKFEDKKYSDINCHLMAVISQKVPKLPFELSAFLKIPNQTQIPIRLRELSTTNYLQNPNQPELCICKNVDDMKYVLDWLKDIINTTENSYLAGCPYKYQLNIELFLPFNHLQEEVDLWEIKERGHRKLGQQYRFIVRSLDRFENTDDRNKLIKRWDYIHNNQSLNLLEIIRRLDRENNYNFTQLEYDLLEKEIGFSCNLPDNCYDCEEIFIALLEKGIPLGLWSRPHQCDCEFDQLLHEQIQTIDDLIDTVFQKRQEAHRYRSHADSKWGYYLAMLFDNPNRFPRKKYSNTKLKATGA